MSMDGVAWRSLYNITRAKSGSQPFSRETIKRVLAFAKPYRNKLIAFVLAPSPAHSLRLPLRCWPARW
jgi:ATP-binding cassette subfamily B protein